MSLESLEIKKDIQFSQNDSFNRSSTSSPANSDHNNNSNLVADSQTTTGNTKMYKCKQCVFICVNKEDYWLHQRQMHIKPEKLLECSKCPFVTEYKHHLEYHLRNHMGSKPYKCTQCEYACVNLSMLRSHSKSHSKAIQYNCAECSYSTKYYNSLKAHMDKFNHTCSNTANTVNTSSMTSSAKMRNQLINQQQKTAASFSSSSSTCSSSSFDNTYNQALANSRKSTNKKKTLQNDFKDGSVNSSSSSVSSASSSLSSSPNWTSQLNINPNLPAKQQQPSSGSISPQMNFNTAAALAAAAMAYQQQQSTNFLLNPALLFNTQSLLESVSDTDQINSVINTLNQLNETNAASSNGDSNNNTSSQFNLMQQQIQMALAMATNSPSNQQFSSLFSDIYNQQQIQQQQKSQQDQLLLAYLQQAQHQSQAFQIPALNENHLNLNNKRIAGEMTHATAKQAKNETPNSDTQTNYKPFRCTSGKSRLSNKKILSQHVNHITNHNNNDGGDASESSPSDAATNSSTQLYECFKCELIFRNYDMFCAHKMLHEIQEQKSTGDSETDGEDKYSSQEDASEFFNCNRCGTSVSNALQFYIHMQACHLSDSYQLGDSDSLRGQLIDPVEEET